MRGSEIEALLAAMLRHLADRHPLVALPSPEHLRALVALDETDD